MMTSYYKVLQEDGVTSLYGYGEWPEGEWLPPVKGKLALCSHGYHLCRPQDIVYHIGPVICPAEVAEGVEVIEEANKVVVRGPVRRLAPLATWNEKSQRLWACDCAERVLYLYEQRHPGDDRPRRAIEVARRYARGEATTEELGTARVAARAAAYLAAFAAAFADYTAAFAAVCSTDYFPLSHDTAFAAALAADLAAAAGAVAADARERTWQTERLWQYLNGEVADMPE